MRPGPAAPIVPARPAATICLIRDESTLEVVLVRRAASATFMPGAWVFPGGTVDTCDTGPLARRLVGVGLADALKPFAAAALRELVEETGIWLSPAAFPGRPAPRPGGRDVFKTIDEAGAAFTTSELVHFANLETPTVLTRRFDTHFFAARAPDGADPVPDGIELDRAEWISPKSALEEAGAGRRVISPPTTRALEELARHATVMSFLAVARNRGPVQRLRPRLRFTDDHVEAVAPGEPGFDDLEDLPPDPELLRRAGVIRHPGST